MAKNKKIEVQGISITMLEKETGAYLSLTDIVSGFEGGSSLIENWLRNKNTLELLAMWEKLFNRDGFNSLESEGIISEAGTNRFVMSVKQWVQKTNAIGITATAGRYGGTYAHSEIALDFCYWLSPMFRLLIIKEFQRLKSLENKEWDLGRMLSKVNYHLQTEAIKEVIIPQLQPITKDRQGFIYADEADLLNLALFGMTAKEWKANNPELANKGMNIRDWASIPQLIVLSNLESYNAIMIKKSIGKEERFLELQKIALDNLRTLETLSVNLDSLKSPNYKLLEKKD